MTQGLVEASTLLDQQDWELWSQDGEWEQHEVQQHPQEWSAWSNSVTGFSRLVQTNGQRVTKLMKTVLAQQAAFFHQLLSNPSLHRYTRAVMVLDTLRTEILVAEVRSSTAQRNAQAFRHTLDDLLSPETTAAVKTTNWQLRMLIPGVDVHDGLTDTQLRHFHRDPLSNSMRLVDLSKVVPGGTQKGKSWIPQRGRKPGHLSTVRRSPTWRGTDPISFTHYTASCCDACIDGINSTNYWAKVYRGSCLRKRLHCTCRRATRPGRYRDTRGCVTNRTWLCQPGCTKRTAHE